MKVNYPRRIITFPPGIVHLDHRKCTCLYFNIYFIGSNYRSNSFLGFLLIIWYIDRYKGVDRSKYRSSFYSLFSRILALRRGS